MKKLLLFLFFYSWNIFVSNAQVFESAKVFGIGTPTITNDDQNLIVYSTLDSATLSSLNLNTSPGRYLIKFDQADSVMWAKKIMGPLGGPHHKISLETDSDQNIIMSGTYYDSLYIDSLIFKNPPRTSPVLITRVNIFTTKFNAAGNLLWARNSDTLLGVATNAIPHKINIDTDTTGNIYLSGDFGTAISFDSLSVNAAGTFDMFLLKYDKHGNIKWLKSGLTSPDYEGSFGIKVSPIGDIHLAYYTQNPVNPRIPPIHLKKLNTGGIQLWHQTFPYFWMSDFSLDQSGNIYLFGVSDSTASIGNLPVPSTNGYSQSSIIMAKLNSSGSWIWVKEIIQGKYWGSINGIGNLVNNAFSISGTFTGSATIGNRNFSTSYPANERYIAKIDTSGTAYNGITIKSTTEYTLSDYGTYIVTNSNGRSYLSSAFGAFGPYTIGDLLIGPFVLTAFPPAYTITYGTGYLVKLQDNSNQVLGTIFIDSNANGIKDSLEIPVENGFIEITPGPTYITSATDGTFSAPVASGLYNLNLIQPTTHYIVSPPIQTGSFTGLGQTQTQNFALIPIPNRNDVKISVTNISQARPGFPLSYRITYENVGTTTLSDSILLNYNAIYLTFSSSSTLPSLQQAGKLKWFYQSLQPNKKRHFYVNFTVASNTPLSTNLQANATIKPIITDFIPANNYDTIIHIVTGSYDPNDKQVNRAILSPNLVATEYLDYTIRFQNTGTDTAFTVIVRDTITQKLFMPSLELLSASHNYTFKLLENNVAEWRFDNILLPDSNRNEPASHGFVRFRIKPQNNLQLGDSITNSAAIYFDYNAPIITNTAVTRISLLLGVKEKKAGLTALQLYPNPATEVLTVAAELKKPKATTVILRNVLGQEVYRKQLESLQQINHKINISQLPKGVYVVQLQIGQEQVSKRVVIL